jgi:hypothetical protein
MKGEKEDVWKIRVLQFGVLAVKVKIYKTIILSIVLYG